MRDRPQRPASSMPTTPWHLHLRDVMVNEEPLAVSMPFGVRLRAYAWCKKLALRPRGRFACLHPQARKYAKRTCPPSTRERSCATWSLRLPTPIKPARRSTAPPPCASAATDTATFGLSEERPAPSPETTFVAQHQTRNAGGNYTTDATGPPAFAPGRRAGRRVGAGLPRPVRRAVPAPGPTVRRRSARPVRDPPG